VRQHIYHILLILTDGEIHDMTQTKDLIVDEASKLPLSIIIIGVGNENFKQMHELDSDNQLLIGSTGREAARDIVQFVRFKKYKQMGADVLAEKVLREVPEQFLSYMNMMGIKPDPSSEVNKKRISQEL
jgi:Copine